MYSHISSIKGYKEDAKMKLFSRSLRNLPNQRTHHAFFLILKDFLVELKPYALPLTGFLFGVLIVCRCNSETVIFIKACFQEAFFEATGFTTSFAAFFLSELPFLIFYICFLFARRERHLLFFCFFCEPSVWALWPAFSFRHFRLSAAHFIILRI